MLLSAGLLTALVVVAQNPTIRVDVPLVTVDVMVSDAAGRTVVNLTRDDFEILEDGKPQEIRVFSPVDSPYSIQVLIDRGAGMNSYLPLFEPALTRFLAGLKPQDRVSIGAFDERSKDVELLLDWREARNGAAIGVALNPVIRGIPFVRSVFGGLSVGAGGMLMGGGTITGVTFPEKDSYAAIEWALKRLAGLETRKGAVIFGDGWSKEIPKRRVNYLGKQLFHLVDGQDDGDFQKLLRAARQSRGRLDFVAVNTDLNSRSIGRSTLGTVNQGISLRARLEQLAASSGGRVSFPQRVEDVSNLFEEIARELGTSYTLGYTPTTPAKNGQAQRIVVRTKNEMTVRQSREEFR